MLGGGGGGIEVGAVGVEFCAEAVEFGGEGGFGLQCGSTGLAWGFVEGRWWLRGEEEAGGEGFAG